MITHLELKNFTAFKHVRMDLSPKINVIIGENGTGKTHLLKAVYALCSDSKGPGKKAKVTKRIETATIDLKLLRLFLPLKNKLGKLVNHGASGNAELTAHFHLGGKVAISINSKINSVEMSRNSWAETSTQPAVYIPTKEVLSLVQGLNHAEHDQNTIELIFDDSYLDLSNLLIKPGHEDPDVKIQLDPRFGTIVPMLVNLIGGKYHWENGGFCFQEGYYEEKLKATRFRLTREPKFASSMTAEGFKKIGILHRLLVNGSLNPGVSGPLLWDEPESNLNPKLMKQVVQILLELSRNGQQIIVATHDYVLLKWFDLLMDKKGKDDHIRFHSLYRDKSTFEIKVASTEDYLKITPNPIDDAFGYLINKEIENDMGSLGK